LNSKEYLANEAERLYVYDFNTTDENATKMKLSPKTICRWKEKFDWEHKKKSFLKSKMSFHQELYEFARKLMFGIATDMAAGEKIDPGRMYAFCRIIPMFGKVKEYEDVVAKKQIKEEPKGLTPELIARIEEEVLGITRNDNANEEE